MNSESPSHTRYNHQVLKKHPDSDEYFSEIEIHRQRPRSGFILDAASLLVGIISLSSE